MAAPSTFSDELIETLACSEELTECQAVKAAEQAASLMRRSHVG